MSPVNRTIPSGVLSVRTRMEAMADALPGTAVTRPPESLALEAEFEARLADSSALAFRVALSVLRNRADAEDVAQEALLRAYRNIGQLRERERFRGWLVRIVWRLSLDRIRASRRRERYELAAPPSPPGSSVEDEAAAREFRRRVDRAMDELPERLRIVVILAAMQGHSTREVAELLGVPEGTVKSRLFQARKALTEKLR